MQVIHYFEVYSGGVKNFKYQFFLINPFNEEGHAKIYDIETEPEYLCTNLFHKFRSQGHFLTGNEFYVYKEDDLS